MGFHIRHPSHFPFHPHSDKQLSCLGVLCAVNILTTRPGRSPSRAVPCYNLVSSPRDACGPTTSPTLRIIQIYSFCQSLWHLALIFISLIISRLFITLFALTHLSFPVYELPVHIFANFYIISGGHYIS